MLGLLVIALQTALGLVPTVQNFPPVDRVCRPFGLDLLTIDPSDGSVVAQDLDVVILIYSAKLYKTSSCSLVGTTGCSVSGLEISTAGTYYIVITDTLGNVLYNSNTFIVVSDFQNIGVVPSSYTPSAFFDMILAIACQDLCGNTINISTAVSISSNYLAGTQSCTTFRGTCVMLVHFTQSGNQTVLATSGNNNGTATIEVQQDSLKCMFLGSPVRSM
jgi:hypothetical protein